MEPQVLPTIADVTASQQLCAALELERHKVRAAQIPQQQRFRELESRLNEQIERLLQDLSSDQFKSSAIARDLDRRQEELDACAAELNRLEAEIELEYRALQESRLESQQRLEQREVALSLEAQALEERSGQLDEKLGEVARLREQLQAEQQQSDLLQRQLTEQAAQLQQRSIGIDQQTAELEAQLRQLNEREHEQKRCSQESEALRQQQKLELDRREQLMQALAEELAGRRAELDQAERTLVVDRQRLEVAAQSAQEREARLTNLQSELKKQEQRLAEESARLAAQQTEFSHQLAKLSESQSVLAAEQAELANRSKKIQEDEEALARRSEQCAQIEAELADQRDMIRRAQQEFEAQRSTAATELAAEKNSVERQRRELAEQKSRLDKAGVELQRRETQLASDRDKVERSQQEVLEFQAAAEMQIADQRTELDRQVQRFMDQKAEWSAAQGEASDRVRVLSAEQQKLECELAAATKNRDAAEKAQQHLLEQVARLEKEVIELRAENESHSTEARSTAAMAQIEELERQLDCARQEVDDLSRKHQMALDDLRAERHKKNDLEARHKSEKHATEGGLDWESRKRLLLAALEADEAGRESLPAADRRRIEEALRATEQLLEDKDREIRELQRVLDEQSNQIGSLAVGAQAIAAVLDNDAVIMEERSKLAALQQEWEEKLRKAEIDMSLERAKIARQRMEIEEKLRHIEPTSVEGDQPVKPRGTQKPARGRWLARLGLRDEDQSARDH